MKLIHKSYKFKIAPDNEQKELLAKHFGACRFVFNRYLNSRKETYLEEKKSLNYYDNANDLTVLKKDEQFVWLKEINSQSLQSSLRNLDTAYNKFFRSRLNFRDLKASLTNKVLQYRNQYISKMVNYKYQNLKKELR